MMTTRSESPTDGAITARRNLFIMCCMALTVTSMTFAIRAGILNELGTEFGLNNVQLGWVNSMAFLGFPLAMIVGGLVYNAVGPKRMMVAAFVGHLAGLLLTIVAGGFWTLLISTFFIGFANGAVEAACNPLVAQAYPDKRTAMLNRFHVWFPGGIVIGALISQTMASASLGWQLQVATMLVPTLIYGLMIFRLPFDGVKPVGVSTSNNIKALWTPLFFVIAALMTLTATTELGTQQWVEKILGASGASPMLILALITGLMAVGRFYAGPIIKALSPQGVLLGSAILSASGIGLMSVLTGPSVYLAAIVFALGVTYFWPTMLGWVSEDLPQTGALGMSLVGGAGMFALSLWNPVIGSWVDGALAQAAALGLTGEAADLAAGQAVLRKLIFFPLVLVACFGAVVALKRRQRAGQTGQPLDA